MGENDSHRCVEVCSTKTSKHESKMRCSSWGIKHHLLVLLVLFLFDLLHHACVALGQDTPRRAKPCFFGASDPTSRSGGSGSVTWSELNKDPYGPWSTSELQLEWRVPPETLHLYRRIRNEGPPDHGHQMFVYVVGSCSWGYAMEGWRNRGFQLVSFDLRHLKHLIH